MTKELLSHGSGISFKEVRERIIKRGNMPDATVEELLEIADQCKGFALGLYLMENSGLNGFWTDYLVSYPDWKSSRGDQLSEMERRFLEGPTSKATQQRARHFARLIGEHICEGVVMASLPCGLMRDLLDQDYSSIKEFQLVGIDMDPRSLEDAREMAENRNLGDRVTFREENAWDLNESNKYHLIASNGLNIYEPDDQKVVELYRRFYEAIRPGGVLVTSSLTPPPGVAPGSEWLMDQIDLPSLQLQKLLFGYIIEASWQCFRSSDKTLEQLKEAGFNTILVHFDDAHIFPTFLAQKA